ncbi:hypothetical protein [Stenotrophomonas maltophilia]|uniref:hypothetical protein n=1 Tax=Stenotrophomonas maltophilia TaxID=40324 RepID=UPI003BF79897
MFCEICGAQETNKNQKACKSCNNEFAARSFAYIYSPIITTPALIVLFWWAFFTYLAKREFSPEAATFLLFGGFIYGITITAKRWKKSRK